MKKKHTLYLLGLAVIIVAFTSPPLNEPMIAETRLTKLVLFNNTVDTLQYAVFEYNAAKFTSWEPCDHPQLCGNQRIKPGLARDMPYEEIYRWHPGAEVVVYWWRLEPDTTGRNGYRLDGPYHVKVATPKKPLLGS